MSYRPRIGGKLREETSGVDRSQVGWFGWGLDPIKEIGQTCGLNVIMRREAPSNRSVVTAAKLVYSTWKMTQPGERNGKAIYRNRLASQPVYLLHSIGERAELCDGVGAGSFGAVCVEAEAQRRGCRGDHVQHEIVSRRSSAASGTRGGCRHESAPGDKTVV